MGRGVQGDSALSPPGHFEPSPPTFLGVESVALGWGGHTAHAQEELLPA